MKDVVEDGEDELDFRIRHRVMFEKMRDNTGRFGAARS